jgi:hypothetical protein
LAAPESNLQPCRGSKPQHNYDPTGLAPVVKKVEQRPDIKKTFTSTGTNPAGGECKTYPPINALKVWLGRMAADALTSSGK